MIPYRSIILIIIIINKNNIIIIKNLNINFMVVTLIIKKLSELYKFIKLLYIAALEQYCFYFYFVFFFKKKFFFFIILLDIFN